MLSSISLEVCAGFLATAAPVATQLARSLARRPVIVVFVRHQSTIAVETSTPIIEVPSPDLPLPAEIGTIAAAMSTTTVASSASQATAAPAASNSSNRDEPETISAAAAELVDRILGKSSYGAHIYKRERLHI